MRTNRKLMLDFWCRRVRIGLGRVAVSAMFVFTLQAHATVVAVSKQHVEHAKCRL